MRGQFNLSIQVSAFIFTFVLALIAGPILIPVLRRLKVGQTVRDDGPATHLKKSGTPTMGGIIFLIPIAIVCAYFSIKQYSEIIPLLITTLGFGTIGFIDDFIKVVLRRKDGLLWDQKMFGLLIVSVTFTIYAVRTGILNTEIIVPFKGMDYTVSLPMWFFVPFTIFVLLATTNAVNLTDGVDGLAAGITLIIMVFFTIVAMTRSEWDYLKIFSATVAGGCLGFLAFNIHPAKVFMGDTGSLALGGAVSAISILMKMPWIILVAGFIFVVEVLSDIIQVAYYKRTKKRIFKMAPIHHHFELSGWKETKVVFVFWTVTVICCMIALLTLRLKFF
ncbi:MAG TPA: phospho-N-acetylmuramoyl-pentapeptide-transferase [Clostridiaceae bacterium]|nr:phospho-N-acetylmuramoyl-pentapeptide-transferase [Clostridiaceae bacterium]